MIIQATDSATQASFSFRNRLARAVWGFAWLVLFRPSPRPFHGWRAFVLRRFGATIGGDSHIYPGVRIWAPWNLKVGNRAGVADGVILYNMASLDIGDQCVVSQGAHLCGGSHDVDSIHFQLTASPIVLEPNVWICADAFVGPGVRIHEGVVLGARSVAMQSITQPWTVWAGHPASFKRARKQWPRQRQHRGPRSAP